MPAQSGAIGELQQVGQKQGEIQLLQRFGKIDGNQLIGFKNGPHGTRSKRQPISEEPLAQHQQGIHPNQNCSRKRRSLV